MKCPGQDRGNWTGDPVREAPCPECGAAVEIFRDEGAGHCPRCGHQFLALAADFGCAQWCSVAKECLGFAPDRQSQPGSAEGVLAARLIQRVERVCKNDPARIAHALRVFQFAKELVREEGGDPRVVLCASLLLSTGAFESDGAENANEGPTYRREAREILRQMNLDEVTQARVCQIMLAARGGQDLDAIELRVVCDSDQLAKLAVRYFAGTHDELEDMIQASLRTETGRRKARGLAQVEPPAGSTAIIQDA